MTQSHCGTIAQLLYPEKHHLNFARIVEELHALFVRFLGPDFIFEWTREFYECTPLEMGGLPMVADLVLMQDKRTEQYVMELAGKSAAIVTGAGGTSA